VAIASSIGASRTFIDSVTKTTAGQAGIAGSELKQMPLPLPPLLEQNRIVAEVERQFSFIEAAERAVETGLLRSAALRRSILKAAFEGRLVRQDPTDEPASVLLDRIRAERLAAASTTPKKTRSKVAK
jgi:type I restriction enzyme, S subunit